MEQERCEDFETVRYMIVSGPDGSERKILTIVTGLIAAMKALREMRSDWPAAKVEKYD